jgi:hypothetical protein
VFRPSRGATKQVIVGLVKLLMAIVAHLNTSGVVSRQQSISAKSIRYPRRFTILSIRPRK